MREKGGEAWNRCGLAGGRLGIACEPLHHMSAGEGGRGRWAGPAWEQIERVAGPRPEA